MRVIVRLVAVILCGFGVVVDQDCVLSGCSVNGCKYTVVLKHNPGSTVAYTLQVRASLGTVVGNVTTLSWEYTQCSASEFGVLDANSSITCQPCPSGGNCDVTAVSARDNDSSSSVVNGSNSSSNASVTALSAGVAVIVDQSSIQALVRVVCVEHCSSWRRLGLSLYVFSHELVTLYKRGVAVFECVCWLCVC